MKPKRDRAPAIDPPPATPATPATPAKPDVPLDELVARIAGHLAEARRVQNLARFACGDAVHLLRYSDCRHRALEQLAEGLQLELSGLMRIARTAERIQAAERAELLALVDIRGLPLSWSHLALLANVRSRERRLHIARRVLEQRMSLRTLQIQLSQENVSRSSRAGRCVG